MRARTASSLEVRVYGSLVPHRERRLHIGEGCGSGHGLPSRQAEGSSPVVFCFFDLPVVRIPICFFLTYDTTHTRTPDAATAKNRPRAAAPLSPPASGAFVRCAFKCNASTHPLAATRQHRPSSWFQGSSCTVTRSPSPTGRCWVFFPRPCCDESLTLGAMHPRSRFGREYKST